MTSEQKNDWAARQILPVQWPTLYNHVVETEHYLSISDFDWNQLIALHQPALDFYHTCVQGQQHGKVDPEFIPRE